MSTSLRDRTVLVVGRASGIARAVAEAVRDAGGTVVAAGRDTAALSAVHGTAEYVDLTDEASIAALAERLGHVDHVVSTASARARGAVGDLTHDTVLRSFDVKVVGPILLAKHLAPRMPEDGSFVLFSGASARKPMAGMLAATFMTGVSLRRRRRTPRLTRSVTANSACPTRTTRVFNRDDPRVQPRRVELTGRAG